MTVETVVPRIWKRDVSVWMPSGRESEVTARAIANRLGWLDAPDAMRAHVPRVQALAEQARAEGVRDVYLLGMGGSSLCAEVMRTSAAAAGRAANVHVLDTTDEHAIAAVRSRMDLPHAWFIVASKSGTTVEATSLERHFWSLAQQALGANAGRHFVAITDPGTPLEALARERGYRETFLNPPDIGGRFSALSLFGMVPAALAGLDVAKLLTTGSEMAEGCRSPHATNPGWMLGSFMAEQCRQGRDKLTLLLPSSLRMLGLWIEQLVAESTGKQRTGILPVVDEPPGEASSYGADRAFVTLETEDEDVAADRAAIEKAGHPMMRLTLRSDALGAEFFRWEFATAVAGALLGINPFDEPNVQEAKDRTRALLAQLAQTGQLPDAVPQEDESVASLGRLLRDLSPPRYLGVLLYAPADSTTIAAIDEFRRAVRGRCRVATTLGVGPRYLHSTGQYHKGGPDTGSFLLITADDQTETRVPEAPYTFSALKRAQAIGDLQALQAHGRRTARIHLRGTATHAEQLRSVLAASLEQPA